ncbi:MAG: hypothetical protein ABIA04_12125 [Pseudomonadota bacterium]
MHGYIDLESGFNAKLNAFYKTKRKSKSSWVDLNLMDESQFNQMLGFCYKNIAMVYLDYAKRTYFDNLNFVLKFNALVELAQEKLGKELSLEDFDMDTDSYYKLLCMAVDHKILGFLTIVRSYDELGLSVESRQAIKCIYHYINEDPKLSLSDYGTDVYELASVLKKHRSKFGIFTYTGSNCDTYPLEKKLILFLRLRGIAYEHYKDWDDYINKD